MSDRKAKQYNLRSNKQGQLHMPIHKLCDDTEFLTEMLGKQLDPGDISSHDSNIFTLDSELHCSGLISQSNNEAHLSKTDSHTLQWREKCLPTVGTPVRIRFLKPSLINRSYISSQY